MLVPSPADQIRDLLVGAALIGGSTGWVPYVGGFGDADQSVCCIDQPGRQPEVLVGIDYPGLQVLVRGARGQNHYGAVWAKARAIYNKLHAIPTPGIATFPELTSCVARSGIAPLGMDSETRHLLSLNFNLITTPTDLVNRT